MMTGNQKSSVKTEVLHLVEFLSMCNYTPSCCCKMLVRVTRITFGAYKCMKKDFKSFLTKVFTNLSYVP